MMRLGVLRLALASLRYRWLRSGLLALCLALVLVLPLASHLLVDHYERTMRRRAAATPLVLGARGSQLGLVLSSLYFRAERLDPVEARHWRELAAEDRGLVVPLYAGHSAGGRPLIGTDLDYFGRRGLRLAEGRWPSLLSEVVVGAEAAAALELGPGSSLLSDRSELYNLAGAYPLRLRVVGVLEASGGPDDGVLFGDVKTTWVVEGLAHGHRDVVGESAVVPLGVVKEFNEIDARNVASFHFHGDPAGFPLSACLLFPASERDRTVWATRFGAHPQVQVVSPQAVIDDLLAAVFRLQAFFDAQLSLVLLAQAGLFGLIVTLSVRLRRAELRTLFRLGCARGTIAWLVAWELVILAACGALLGGISAWILARLVVALGWLL